MVVKPKKESAVLNTSDESNDEGISLSQKGISFLVCLYILIEVRFGKYGVIKDHILKKC
jgi:hypothetical protein